MIYKNLLEIADSFDNFIFDAYGVFKFQEGVSKSAIGVLETLVKQGKKVTVLSNSTASSEKSVASYEKKGLLKDKHYLELLTSGQFAYEAIQAGQLPVEGKKVYIEWTANFKIPDDKIPDLLKDSDYNIVENIEDADFVYCGIPQINYEDRLEIDEFLPELEKIKESGLKMVCANPDMRALESLGFVVRQGLVSAKFEEMGGEVIYYGKPDSRIFERAIKSFGEIDKLRTLMIGDTVRTDILGANRANIKNCLVLENAVTANEMKEKNIELTVGNIHKYAKDTENAVIDYIIEKLPEGDLF